MKRAIFRSSFFSRRIPPSPATNHNQQRHNPYAARPSSLHQTDKRRREALAEYAAAASQRERFPTGNGHPNGNCNGNVNGTSNGRAAPQQGGAESRPEAEARLREALTRANAEHFKSWLMILKVRRCFSKLQIERFSISWVVVLTLRGAVGSEIYPPQVC